MAPVIANHLFRGFFLFNLLCCPVMTKNDADGTEEAENRFSGKKRKKMFYVSEEWRSWQRYTVHIRDEAKENMSYDC